MAVELRKSLKAKMKASMNHRRSSHLMVRPQGDPWDEPVDEHSSELTSEPFGRSRD